MITGSFNFTKAAEENNAENLLVNKDRKLALTCFSSFDNSPVKRTFERR